MDSAASFHFSCWLAPSCRSTSSRWLDCLRSIGSGSTSSCQRCPDQPQRFQRSIDKVAVDLVPVDFLVPTKAKQGRGCDTVVRPTDYKAENLKVANSNTARYINFLLHILPF